MPRLAGQQTSLNISQTSIVEFARPCPPGLGNVCESLRLIVQLLHAIYLVIRRACMPRLVRRFRGKCAGMTSSATDHFSQYPFTRSEIAERTESELGEHLTPLHSTRNCSSMVSLGGC